MAFGGGLDNDEGMVSDINMTPLVDVMLVLLIIFILTVPVLTHAVKLDLPKASTVPQVLKPDMITVSVTADGAIHWNDSVLDAAQLQSQLQRVAARQPPPEIYIRGDRKVEYQHVMQVLSAAQHAGIAKLGFVTEPDPH